MTKAFKNIQSIFIIGGFVKILGLFYKIFVTRLLGLEGMTIYSVVFPAIALALALSSCSIPIVCEKRISSNSCNPKDIVKSALRITLVSSSIISLFILLSFPLYKYIYNNALLYYPLLTAIPLIYLSNISGIMKSYLEAKKEFKITQISNLLEELAKIIMCMVVTYIFKNQSIIVLVIIIYLSMSLSEIASFTYLYRKLKKSHNVNIIKYEARHYEKEIIKDAWPITIEHIVLTLSQFIEPLLFTFIIKLKGLDPIICETYYTLVTQYALPLLIMAFFTSQSIYKAIFPYLYEAKGNPKLTKYYLDKALFFCLFAATFNYIVCNFYAEEFLDVLFNNIEAKEIVKKLSLCYFIIYFEPILRGTLNSNNLEKWYLNNTIISKIFVLISIITLTFIFGLEGFVYSLAIGTLAKNILDMILIKKKLVIELKLQVL